MGTKNTRDYLVYKGKPLIRCDQVLYYGSMADSYIVRMQIFDTKTDHGKQVASKVMVTLMSTDMNRAPAQRVIKSGEKNGLYDAIDIADIWLTRALAARN